MLLGKAGGGVSVGKDEAELSLRQMKLRGAMPGGCPRFLSVVVSLDHLVRVLVLWRRVDGRLDGKV